VRCYAEACRWQAVRLFTARYFGMIRLFANDQLSVRRARPQQASIAYIGERCEKSPTRDVDHRRKPDMSAHPTSRNGKHQISSRYLVGLWNQPMTSETEEGAALLCFPLEDALSPLHRLGQRGEIHYRRISSPLDIAPARFQRETRKVHHGVINRLPWPQRELAALFPLVATVPGFSSATMTPNSDALPHCIRTG